MPLRTDAAVLAATILALSADGRSPFAHAALVAVSELPPGPARAYPVLPLGAGVPLSVAVLG